MIEPRDNRGRWETEGLNDSQFCPLDRQLVDYEPGRPLTDPEQDKTIASLIPGARFVPYTQTAFFPELQIMQGTPNISSGDANEVARNALFGNQPLGLVKTGNVPIYTQNVVNMNAIGHLCSGDDEFTSKPIFVVRHDSRIYIIDGHHRIVAAAIMGHKTCTARVLNIT